MLHRPDTGSVQFKGALSDKLLCGIWLAVGGIFGLVTKSPWVGRGGQREWRGVSALQCLFPSRQSKGIRPQIWEIEKQRLKDERGKKASTQFEPQKRVKAIRDSGSEGNNGEGGKREIDILAKRVLQSHLCVACVSRHLPCGCMSGRWLPPFPENDHQSCPGLDYGGRQKLTAQLPAWPGWDGVSRGWGGFA